jgi:hypothetical protein
MPGSTSASWKSRLAVTLVVGLIFVAAGAEALAAYNACAEDPLCLPAASAFNLGAFFAILAAGIVLAVAGAWALTVGRAVLRMIPS